MRLSDLAWALAILAVGIYVTNPDVREPVQDSLDHLGSLEWLPR